MLIDISEKIPGAPHFTWKEALELRDWELYAHPLETEARKIIEIAGIMEDIRRILGNKPLYITSWFRPRAYNEKIGGSWLSRHIYGKAVDFKAGHMTPNEIRAVLKGHLDILGIRLHDSNRNYVHIDTGMPHNGKRTFK